MAVSISITEGQALSALRTFLLGILPSETEIVRGQINRVPEPTSVNFVTMTPLMRERLATNIEDYEDLISSGYLLATQPTQFTAQLDFHGPASGENVQIFTTLWRSGYGVDVWESTITATATAVDENGNVITTDGTTPLQYTATIGGDPLYHSDPRQLPFINGEQQYEERWSIDAVMQINPVVQVPQQFAGSILIGIYEVDAAFPPV